jgi:glycosyltransferase involved in cell wall biosynthesis
MRILIHSPAFLPAIGGLEINTAALAQSLAAMGDAVAVVTRTPADREVANTYSVVRNPSSREFLSWTKWAEVVLHQNLSLRGLWPLLFVRRPLVVSHHSWYRRVNGRKGFRDFVKRFVVRRATGSIAVSQAIAQEIGGSTVVVENGFRDELFRLEPTTPRDRELLFVGRLVSDKGADTLLRALRQLRDQALRPRLTVVGDGPEMEALVRLANELDITSQVTFAGCVVDEELAGTYRRHEIIVVPSLYEEPFGIVALEGIASGCVAVGSSGGGLPSAIGACGLVFPNGDVNALATTLTRVLTSRELREQLRSHRETHVAAHAERRMVGEYRRVLVAAVATWSGR